MPLWPFDQLPFANFTWFLGPNLFGEGPANDILRGPCQQLLTLLTLKTALLGKGLLVTFENIVAVDMNKQIHQNFVYQ